MGEGMGDDRRHQYASDPLTEMTELDGMVSYRNLKDGSHGPTRQYPCGSGDQDWDGGYIRRQPQRVMRNDRTPLNTPYTPQLASLHMSGHEEFYDEAEEDGRTIAQSIGHGAGIVASTLSAPARSIRQVVSALVSLVLPQRLVQSPLYQKYGVRMEWCVSCIVCIPFLLLLSPFCIAICISSTPIWIAMVLILLIRRLLPSNLPLGEEDMSMDMSSPMAYRRQEMPHRP